MSQEELPAELRCVLAVEGLEEAVSLGVDALDRIAAATETLAALQYASGDVSTDDLRAAHDRLAAADLLRPRPAAEP